jgi:DNA-binding HxlR family transcriptional regulator
MRKLLLSRIFFGGKICYTVPMNTTNHPLTTEQPGACTTHPMGHALRLLGDKWTLMLVYTLLSGPRRFGELLEALGNVSPKTVSQRLKMLEEIGFVQRQAFAEIPPRVEYRLTEKGLALVDIMEAIRLFAERYLTESELASPDSPTTSPSCQ